MILIKTGQSGINPNSGERRTLPYVRTRPDKPVMRKASPQVLVNITKGKARGKPRLDEMQMIKTRDDFASSEEWRTWRNVLDPICQKAS